MLVFSPKTPKQSVKNWTGLVSDLYEMKLPMRTDTSDTDVVIPVSTLRQELKPASGHQLPWRNLAARFTITQKAWTEKSYSALILPRDRTCLVCNSIYVTWWFFMHNLKHVTNIYLAIWDCFFFYHSGEGSNVLVTLGLITYLTPSNRTETSADSSSVWGSERKLRKSEVLLKVLLLKLKQ